MSPSPTPTIGRIVHFYDHTRSRDNSGKPGPFAAIVTGISDVKQGWNATLSLTIFPAGYPPVAVFGVPVIDASDDGVYWTWPPREAS